MLANELDKDLEHLRKDVLALRDDVSSLAASVKHLAAARGRDAIERIEELGERAKARAVDTKDAAEHTIGAHPFVSVAASFGLGIVLGLLLERKR